MKQKYIVKLSFRIIRRKYLRKYSYTNPRNYNRNDAVKFTEILNLIKREFELMEF